MHHQKHQQKRKERDRGEKKRRFTVHFTVSPHQTSSFFVVVIIINTIDTTDSALTSGAHSPTQVQLHILMLFQTVSQLVS
jgi:hypothetical protein